MLCNILYAVGKEDKEETSAGCHLCKALVPVYEQAVTRSTDHKNTDRLHAAAALRNLLAVSQKAKGTTLQSKILSHICLTLSIIKGPLKLQHLYATISAFAWKH